MEENITIENIDEEEERKDAQYVTEYVNDIYAHLRERELLYQLSDQKIQKDFSVKMRMILIDWLIDVAHRFKLLSDSLHLTVSLFDQFCAKEALIKSQAQLYGMACMLIACKFEEIFFPEVADFIYICDGNFDRSAILKAETYVLTVLNYKICIPTPLIFLRRFSKAAFSDPRTHTLSKYLLEVSLLHFDATHKYLPSLLAASSVYLANCMISAETTNNTWKWNETMQHYTGYTLAQLKEPLDDFQSWLKEINGNNCQYTAPYRNYAQKFFGVAKIKFIS